MIKTFFVFFLTVLSLIYLPITAVISNPLTVNIISHSLTNGAGKQVDVTIIKDELERLGHRVNLCDFNIVHEIPTADINLFLAQFKRDWFSQARLNWFVPNAEVCSVSVHDLQDFDLILCKTKESSKIFSPICKKIFYLGFTSIDRYDPTLSLNKNFSKYLHVAGKSRMKGSGAVMKAWARHSSFPNLTMIKHSKHSGHRTVDFNDNFQLITKRISDQELLILQNECGIHLCPSKTEGFGHYIMEAMSVGAVVITTNAPPMKEFIKDKRCLVDYILTEKRRYATIYTVDSYGLSLVIKKLNALSPEKLQKIGEKNRAEFKRRTEEFRMNFEKLMKRAERDLS